MKNFLILIGVVLSLICTTVNAEYYKVYVKRDDSNLYIDTSTNLIIKTKYCYEYTYGDEAVLIYDKYSYSNQLVFKNGQKCDVDWIAVKQ